MERSRARRTALLAGLAATTTTPTTYGQIAKPQSQAGEEVVLAAEATARYLEFRVRTGGCTRKAHFGVETLSKSPLTVRLLRLRPDYCEAHLPEGEKIRFTYAEIGAPTQLAPEELRRVVIVNERIKQ